MVARGLFSRDAVRAALQEMNLPTEGVGGMETFSLDREFDNGFRVGGFFTLTDASEEDFGEGSFDKGISVSIPTDWFFGTPSRRRITTSFNSLTRDGGQKVSVPGRLYGTVSSAQNPDLEEGWGRFWR